MQLRPGGFRATEVSVRIPFNSGESGINRIFVAMLVLREILQLTQNTAITLKFQQGVEEDTFLYRLADLLLNRSQIICFRNKFRIVEAELYIFQEGHFDPFAIGAEGKMEGNMQSTSGNWFVHGGGMEFTFGEPQKFRGILIRRIERLDDSHERTETAWDTKELLLQLSNQELRKNLKLEPARLEEREIGFDLRLNLNAKTSTRFASLPYRFFTIDPS